MKFLLVNSNNIRSDLQIDFDKSSANSNAQDFQSFLYYAKPLYTSIYIEQIII